MALSAHEPLQFLRDETGGFFVAHQDGNTPLTRHRTRDPRISIVIFLNAQTPGSLPGGYTGGELVFHAPYPHLDKRQAVVGAAGSLLAFPSETTHEATMVPGGTPPPVARSPGPAGLILPVDGAGRVHRLAGARIRSRARCAPRGRDRSFGHGKGCHRRIRPRC